MKEKNRNIETQNNSIIKIMIITKNTRKIQQENKTKTTKKSRQNLLKQSEDLEQCQGTFRMFPRKFQKVSIEFIDIMKTHTSIEGEMLN